MQRKIATILFLVSIPATTIQISDHCPPWLPIREASAQPLPVTITITAVVPTSDGGLLAAGYCGMDLIAYLYLAKTDSSGTTQWVHNYGESMNFSALKEFHSNRIYSAVQTSDGGYALAGTTDSYGALGYDFWLVKTDPLGNAEWNRTYGGVDSDQARSIIEVSDGGYLLAGWTNSFGSGGWDYYLVRTDASGTMEWNRTYGGPKQEILYCLIQTSDGGFAMAGETNSYGLGGPTTSGEPGFDAWLVKTDSQGNLQWSKTYGTSEDGENAYCVIETADNGYVLGGASGFTSFFRDAYMVRADSTGNEQWNRGWGSQGNDEIHAIAQADDGGYLFAGSTPSASGKGNYDFLLIKTDASGKVAWRRSYGGDENEEATVIVGTGDGGFTLLGGMVTADTGGTVVREIMVDSSGASPEYPQGQTSTDPRMPITVVVVIGILAVAIAIGLSRRTR